MAKSIRFKNGNEVYTIDPSGVTAKSEHHKSLDKLINRINTLFLPITYNAVSEEYFLIGTLQGNNSGDATTMRISGTAGGWTVQDKATFDITLTSRGLGGYGIYYGASNAFTWFDIKIYKGTDNLYRVYFHKKNKTYACGVLLLVMYDAINSISCNDTAVSPNGTLAKTFDNTNLTKLA